MSVGPAENNPDDIDHEAYLNLQSEIDEKHNAFMTKHLHRVWPKRVARIIGIFQLLLAFAIAGVDLPIVLMFAPRWQTFAGCWTFLVAFITGISTIRSAGETTWLKLQWTITFNVTCGLAAAIMMALDIINIINPNLCVNIGGCSYLSYTFTAAQPYYKSQTGLGGALLFTAFLIIILFIKYGIGGTTLFDDIQNGWAAALHKPMMEPYQHHIPMNPMVGPGTVDMTSPSRMMMPRPYGPMMMPRPNGPMMAPRPYGPMMVPRPYGPMMVPRPYGPMMVPRPYGPMMVPRPYGPIMMPRPDGPRMMPGPRPPFIIQDQGVPMPPYYGQSEPMSPVEN